MIQSLKKNQRRIWMTVVGVLFGGFSVGLFKNAAFGTDPFQVLCAGLNVVIPISFGTLYLCINAILLVGMFIADRHYIGLGTFINLFLLGYVVEWSTGLWAEIFPEPSMLIRIGFLVSGIVLLCIASSLYMTSDLGVSTYDIWALYLGKHTSIPFKFWRITTDCICVVVGWLLGGVFGVGTIITAFFMGPLIDFFCRHLAQPLLNWKK